ncbi:glycosyltransferase family 4 protein [Algoriphagus machipongonensis]|uniref:Glycosyl transferase n=1 Tax=Algoriphagus machipongonensis TaxID=388413 RepID=A3I1Z2_9BACT|nr:glycosyltransferase family 4 protein [Algoriphagus machipongonensis]EAZ79808.1 glycosyl transferase [Algoriphagus machipongonensis]
MHICFLSNEYPQEGHHHGGIGSFLKVICRGLVNSGHEVTVINGTNAKRRICDDQGVKVIYTPFRYVSGISWWFNFQAVNKELKNLHRIQPIDIVEGSEMSFSFLKKIKGVKYIIRLHGGHHFFAEGENRGIQPWKGFQEKRSFKKADAFIGVSEYVVSHTEKYISFRNKPKEVIFNPINTALFKEADLDLIKPSQLVFVGTLIEKKGIRQLCEALPIVAKLFPNIHLHAYGRDWKDKEGHSYLENLKKNLETETLRKVTFHGPVSHEELPEIYKQCNICVFPSHSETLGLVAPEAMAMQRAVIFTKLGPGPEVIQNGVDGWLVDPRSSNDIAKTIIDILAHPIKMGNVATQAAASAKLKFAPENIIDKNINFYQKILA